MTQFIESFATQYLLPPWISRDASVWVFALALEDAKGIAQFLDDYFNGAGPGLAPSPYVYKPLGKDQQADKDQYAFLVVADHSGAGNIQEKDGAEVVRNRVAYRIVYTTIPVHRYRLTPDNLLLEPPDIVWVRPSTWCNSSTFVFSAREIWGADVEYQQIDRDPEVAAPALHVDTSYIGCEPFAPSSFNELLAALHVRAGRSTAIEEKDLKGHVDDPHLVELLGDLMGGAGELPPPQLFKEAVGSIDIDALKQFRSAEDMRFAIFRGLVASRQWHGQARDLAIHDLTEVEVDFMRSAAVADLHDRFGLTPIGRGAPPDHPPDPPPPPPDTPGEPPTKIRWDLPRGPAEAKLCLSFKTDLYFEVAQTLHVYRPYA